MLLLLRQCGQKQFLPKRICYGCYMNTEYEVVKIHTGSWGKSCTSLAKDRIMNVCYWYHHYLCNINGFKSNMSGQTVLTTRSWQSMTLRACMKRRTSTNWTNWTFLVQLLYQCFMRMLTSGFARSCGTPATWSRSGVLMARQPNDFGLA